MTKPSKCKRKFHFFLIFFFWVLFMWVAMVWKFVTKRKKQNNDSYAPPPRRDLGYDKLFTRETWTKLKFFPQDCLLIAPSPLESTFLFRYTSCFNCPAKKATRFTYGTLWSLEVGSSVFAHKSKYLLEITYEQRTHFVINFVSNISCS